MLQRKRSRRRGQSHISFIFEVSENKFLARKTFKDLNSFENELEMVNLALKDHKHIAASLNKNKK